MFGAGRHGLPAPSHLRGPMNIQIRIGGIRFRFDSEDEILIEESLSPFFYTAREVIDVNIKILRDFSRAPLPCVPMAGEDLLMEYYQQDGQLLCMTKGGNGGYLACCVCAPGYGELTCYLNFAAHMPVNSLGNLLRMIPIRRILQHHGVLFFHASQIAAGQSGILFCAPSGTGKSTQAKLWQQCRSARILCNDRTLIGAGRTYGYPVDGSEPVISGESRNLGALVVLQQAPNNTVRPLRPGEALALLMPQMVIDVWDLQSRTTAAEQLLELLTSCPAYLLRCTPDHRAVECLERQLQTDGVI